MWQKNVVILLIWQSCVYRKGSNSGERMGRVVNFLVAENGNKRTGIYIVSLVNII